MLKPEDMPSPATLTQAERTFCYEYVTRKDVKSACHAAYPDLTPLQVMDKAYDLLALPHVSGYIAQLFSIEAMSEEEAVAALAGIARSSKRDQDKLRALEDILKLQGKFDQKGDTGALLVALRTAEKPSDIFALVQAEHYGVG